LFLRDLHHRWAEVTAFEELGFALDHALLHHVGDNDGRPKVVHGELCLAGEVCANRVDVQVRPGTAEVEYGSRAPVLRIQQRRA
jgi:hypothetical protein